MHHPLLLPYLCWDIGKAVQDVFWTSTVVALIISLALGLRTHQIRLYQYVCQNDFNRRCCLHQWRWRTGRGLTFAARLVPRGLYQQLQSITTL
jgi:hypothetical protein